MEECKNTTIKINKENWTSHQLVVPAKKNIELMLGWKDNISKLAQFFIGFYKKFWQNQ